MTVAVVGMGLVSPFGHTPSNHVFFLRAQVPSPPPSPFETKEGKRVDVFFCRWLGARAPVGERLVGMAARAVDTALAPLGAAFESGKAVTVCTSRPRAGMAEQDVGRLIGALRDRLKGRFTICHGEAAIFGALKDASTSVMEGSSEVAVLIVADSFVAVDALSEHVAWPASHWSLAPPPPSEGAAAIVLMDPRKARRANLPILGVIDGARTMQGRSRDDNDEAADGGAMSLAIRDLPGARRVRAAYGQHKTDSLRRYEWAQASARMSDRFEPDCELVCLESQIGRVGAAAGLMSLVYGLAVHDHAATERESTAGAPFFAWAVSPDGTRGIARVEAGAP